MSLSASSAPPNSFSAYSGIGSSSASRVGHSGSKLSRMSAARALCLLPPSDVSSGSSHSGSVKSHVSFSARNRPSALEPFVPNVSASAGRSREVTASGAVCSSVGAHCDKVSSRARTPPRNSAAPGNDGPSARAMYRAHCVRKRSSHSRGRSTWEPSRCTSAGKSASGDTPPPGVSGRVASAPPVRFDSRLPVRPPEMRSLSTSRRMLSLSLGTVATTVDTSASRHLCRYCSLSFCRRSTKDRSRVPHAARSHLLCRRNSDASVRSALPLSTALPRSRRDTRVGSRLLLSSAASAARARAPRSTRPRLSKLRLACCTFGDVSRKPLTKSLMPYLSSTRFNTAGENLAHLASVDAAVPRSCSDLAPDMIATSEPTVSCEENLCAQSPPCAAMFSIVLTA